MIGKTLGHYQITEKLGAGGMGVVYKARDLHLDRFIAIKVLAAEKVADSDRKRRFVQEAKAASALNHPNIIHIYDIDQADGTDFIAMEYVEGKTLDQRIGHRGLRLNDALKYAVQIADALAKAHSAGIVHRDLKPTNIMVNEDGAVKVLDFGLAKLTEWVQGDQFASTATIDDEGRPITEEGVIVGTVSYMSPEQAEGKKVDTRSDIFSLGSVLYEMVTGQKAFQGTSKMSTLSAILHQEPKPVSGTAPTIPADFEKLINRCLRKDLDRRIQHMDDVRLALMELKEDSESGRLHVVPGESGRFTPAWLVIGAVAVLVLVAAGWYWLRPQRGAERWDLLTAVPLTSYPGTEDTPSFSPDGTQVAFQWCTEAPDRNCDIYIKQIGVEPPSRLTTDPAPDYSPAWSPDGRTIAFRRTLSSGRDAIVLLPQRGGQERVLLEISVRDKVLPPEGPYLAWTPDSKWLACPMPEAGKQAWALHLFSVETGEGRRLTTPPVDIPGDTGPAYSPDGGYLTFSRQDRFWHSALYMLRLGEGYRPRGDPERVVLDTSRNSSAVWMPNGRELVFVSGTITNAGLWCMTVFNPATRKMLGFAPSDVYTPAVSREGHHLAYAVSRGDENIWRIDLMKGPDRKPGPPIPFISSTKGERTPNYSPDGKRIAFSSERSGAFEIWVCGSDGSKAAQLTFLGGPFVFGPRWSWDNQSIAFTAVQEGVKEDIFVISAVGGAAKRLTTHPEEDRWPYWSRDGQWIYFASTRSGDSEVWRMPASGGEAVKITHNHGDWPQESPDGKCIYYMKGWPGVVSVWRIPAEGGEETMILDSVHPGGEWAVANEGIYFFKYPDERGHSDICLYEFATGRSRKILTIDRAVDMHIAVSPDSKAILYNQVDEAGSDLMLVENFR